MGSYNNLISEVLCASCGKAVEVEIQFKFGDCHFYHYRLGEQILWGGNNSGRPGFAKVAVDGVGEGECPGCKGKLPEDFVLIIESDVIKTLQPWTPEYCFKSDTYIVLQE